MRKTALIALASTVVALTTSAALAQPGRYYPGDHLLDYDPVNQAYEWQLNGNSQQTGFGAFASDPRAQRRDHIRDVAPATRVQEDPWTKAREDDALEAGHG
ncbi:MAG TPA: hypothetical protein VHA55_10920 [Pseudorhodoplanes sp.]|jgi:hypothetical protein|nr:hypothetical protein [Pseudorhodoplanes sp.]